MALGQNVVVLHDLLLTRVVCVEPIAADSTLNGALFDVLGGAAGASNSLSRSLMSLSPRIAISDRWSVVGGGDFLLYLIGR